MKLLRRAFQAASIVWTVALPLASVLARRPRGPGSGHALAFLVYGAGSFVCHQLPERSFRLWTVPMPVCARCTGIYVGAALAAMLVSLRATVRRKKNTAYKQALLLAAVPTALTLVYEWSTGQIPGGWVRALAGVPMGAVVALLLVTPPGAVE